MCKFSELSWAFESSFSSFCHRPKFRCGQLQNLCNPKQPQSMPSLGASSLSSAFGETWAQLHEHFVAAHMKYACNFEFAIHLNVFLITFYASEPRPWHAGISWAPHSTANYHKQKQDLQRLAQVIL